MKKLFLIALLVSSSPALADTFCMVSGSGYKQCRFASVDSCQQAAREANGICTVNQADQKPKMYTYGNNAGPDIYGAYQKGVADKRAQEEHEARMAAMKADTANKSCPVAVYSCPNPGGGEPIYSSDPIVGCTVAAVLN